MTELFNQSFGKERRKELRQSSTRAEKVLWDILRNRQVLGVKFRRQYGVRSYILDFYAPQLKFAIEADGMAHENKEAEDHDKIRDSYLNYVGIEVKRFKNYEILYNTEGVRSRIVAALQERMERFPSLPRRG